MFKGALWSLLEEQLLRGGECGSWKTRTEVIQDCVDPSWIQWGPRGSEKLVDSDWILKVEPQGLLVQETERDRDRDGKRRGLFQVYCAECLGP